MKTSKLFYLLALATVCSCVEKETNTTIVVKNTLDLERSFETLELTKEFLEVTSLDSLGIRDIETGEIQVTQAVDIDGDGTLDKILFQPMIKGLSEKSYEIITLTETEKIETKELCYSRFVPERTDDYTWENDKVAFRVFGPVAQKMAEDSIAGGTLSSGVDAWLKKVEYPIINKWYKKNSERAGAYHEPSPEGLDNFHVGSSRGVGGIAVKRDSTFYYSKNYSKWRTIATGPIRTSFYLEYESWDADGKLIKESKMVSLDLGSYLSKFTTTIEGADAIVAGLTLHENDGKVTGNKENGWVSYWQPHADSELGTGIVATKEFFQDFEKYVTTVPDQSNAYAHLKVNANKVTYYAGFGWKEAGMFNNSTEWESYLNKFSMHINTPLTVTLKQ